MCVCVCEKERNASASTDGIKSCVLAYLCDEVEAHGRVRVLVGDRQDVHVAVLDVQEVAGPVRGWDWGRAGQRSEKRKAWGVELRLLTPSS